MFDDDMRGKLLKEQLRSCIYWLVRSCIYLFRGSFADETMAGHVRNDLREKLLKELLKSEVVF